MSRLAIIAGVLLSVASAINTAADIRLWTNFTSNAPLTAQWVAGFGTIDAPVEAGLIAGSNTSPHSIDTAIPYCVDGDYIVEMNARIQYSAELDSGVVASNLGWEEDPFYACGYMVASSPEGWRFGHLLTNKKSYALYANYQEDSKAAIPELGQFAFVVPIAKRNQTDVHDYTIMLKRSEYDLSYRIDNVEKLVIRDVGQIIARKFLVWSNELTNVQTDVAFPSALTLSLGVGSLADFGPVTHPVCQLATYNECISNVQYARNVFCRYGGFQGTGTWTILSQAQFSNVFIARITRAQQCRDNWFANSNSSADHWWTQWGKAQEDEQE